MAKPNHFWKASMQPFWYFNVSVGSGEKSFAFQDCAWIVILLHTERTENPHTPKTHSSASNFCKYPSDIPQISLRHTQTSQRQAHGISREHKTLTDANRHRQTPKDTARCCLSMSGRVPWHLLSSAGMSCYLKMINFPDIKKMLPCYRDFWASASLYYR